MGTWAGFVFINMDSQAEPLIDFLGVVPERLSRFRLHEMRCMSQRTAVVGCNWKTAYDAFAEAYHTLGIHPQLLTWMDDTMDYRIFGIHAMFQSSSPHAIGTPSPRLGYVPGREEMLGSMVRDMNSVGMLTEEDLALVEQFMGMVTELPEGEPLTPLFAALRRMQAQSRGFDCADFSDNDMLFGEDWTLFPNMHVPVNAMSSMIIRFRPNGLDPDSCLFEIWNLERFREGQAPAEPPKVEFFDDWRAHDGWGSIMVQDLSNVAGVQQGMHSRRLKHVIVGRQEIFIQNFHRVLMSFLRDDPTESTGP